MKKAKTIIQASFRHIVRGVAIGRLLGETLSGIIAGLLYP